MGVTSSTEVGNLQENRLLGQLIGEKAVEGNNEYWEELLKFSFSYPYSSPEAKAFESHIQPICEHIVANSQKSGNIQKLVQVTVEFLNGLSTEANWRSNLYTWRCCNSLLLVRIIVKYMMENHSDEDIVQLVDTPLVGKASPIASKDPPGVDEPKSIPVKDLSRDKMLTEKLVSSLLQVFRFLPLTTFTYDIHLETIYMLLVLMSRQLFLSRPASQGIFLSHLMATPTEHANVFINRLLTHFITRPEAPPPNYRAQSGGIISSLTSGLWSLVPGSRQQKGGSVLADQSELLLVVIVTHSLGGPKSKNPFRQAVFTFTEDRDKSEIVQQKTFGVNMEDLYFAICKHMSSEQTALLLYFLLHGNQNVASFIFSRSDIDALVIPLVEQLHAHKVGEDSSHHLYMLLIIFLILSQDEVFNKTIHEISLPKVPWYKERNLTNITLGGLVLIVVIQTLQVNISSLRDKYLHTNCLAALANMSSHFNNLQLYPAEKLVGLFKLLSKKHHKIVGRMKGLTPQSPVSPGKVPDYATDLAIVEEVMRMILEIMNSTLSHNLGGNPHLVYSLLYQHEMFTEFRLHPAFTDIISNIEMVVAFFNGKIDQLEHKPLSSQEVMDIVSQASKTWSKTRLRIPNLPISSEKFIKMNLAKQFPDLKFRYVEEEQPDEFFIPYVWSLVYCHSGLFWDGSRVKLQHFQDISNEQQQQQQQQQQQ